MHDIKHKEFVYLQRITDVKFAGNTNAARRGRECINNALRWARIWGVEFVANAWYCMLEDGTVLQSQISHIEWRHRIGLLWAGLPGSLE